MADPELLSTVDQQLEWMALSVIDSVPFDTLTQAQHDCLKSAVLAALKVAWNARGAVDIAKIEHELATAMGSTAAGPYITNLGRALRSLDQPVQGDPITSH